MTNWRAIILGIALLTWSAAYSVAADIVVIVSKDNPLDQLTREQVIDLFMGREINFPGGSPALPMDHPSKSALRERFYLGLTGKSIGEINAYWARLLFTGNASPPRVLPNTPAILQIVEKNPQSISYIDAEDAIDKVKIVFRIETKGPP